MHEYHDLVKSNRWEPADSKEKSQDVPFITKAYYVATEYPVNKILNILKYNPVGKTMAMVEGYLPSLTKLVTTAAKMAISKGIENPMEMVLLDINTRIQ